MANGAGLFRLGDLPLLADPGLSWDDAEWGGGPLEHHPRSTLGKPVQVVFVSKQQLRHFGQPEAKLLEGALGCEARGRMAGVCGWN